MSGRETMRPAAPWRGTAFLVEACLLLAVVAGCVAVFAAGESSPMTTTGIDVRSLREADRALLLSGLPCADRDEVLTLLEDLGS